MIMYINKGGYIKLKIFKYGYAINERIGVNAIFKKMDIIDSNCRNCDGISQSSKCYKSDVRDYTPKTSDVELVLGCVRTNDRGMFWKVLYTRRNR